MLERHDRDLFSAIGREGGTLQEQIDSVVQKLGVFAQIMITIIM